MRSPKEMTTTNWQKIGDLTHFFCLANTALFACAVVLYNETDLVFDPSWRQDGFCVSNKDIPFWNSHDLSLYADTVGAAVLGLLYFLLNDTPGMEIANEFVKVNTVGIFAHGVGHGTVSKAMRDDKAATISGDSTAPNDFQFAVFFPLFCFWIGLLKASMPKKSFKIITPMALIANVMLALLPPQYNFTFVQTVLVFAFSLDQVMRPVEDKTAQYALYPLIVGCPLSMIAWIETTQCSKFVMGLGGHLIYDGYIVISSIFFYLLCLQRCAKSKNTKIKSA